jgi:hypothetical protein
VTAGAGVRDRCLPAFAVWQRGACPPIYALTTLLPGVNIIARREHMLNAKGLREVTVKHVLGALLGAVTLFGSAPSIAQTTLTIATVNNGDMIRMQGLTNEFNAKNPEITV